MKAKVIQAIRDIRHYHKKFILMIVAAEITVLVYFVLERRYMEGFLIVTALGKEVLHGTAIAAAA